MVKQFRVPVRRCVMCGKSAPKGELFRFVAGDGQMAWDTCHSRPGRGAYLHRLVNCWSRMGEMFRWERAFRLGKGALSKESVNFIRQEVYHHLQDMKPEAQDTGRKKNFSKVRL